MAAWTMCEEFVKDRLRSPSTADFPWSYEEHLVSHSGQEYTFDAHVDAENTFGASVRTEFRCTVRNVAGDEWRLVNLDMNPR